MRQVEPDGQEPDQIDQAVDRVAEQVGDVSRSVGRPERSERVVSDDFGELHVIPEVVKVQQQSQYDDESQHEHVPRSPGYRFRRSFHGITLRAPRTAVVQRQDRCIDDMHHETGGQDQRPSECVPVRSQKFTDRIVGLGGKYGCNVHRHVEQQEQDQKKT